MLCTHAFLYSAIQHELVILHNTTNENYQLDFKKDSSVHNTLEVILFPLFDTLTGNSGDTVCNI